MRVLTHSRKRGVCAARLVVLAALAASGCGRERVDGEFVRYVHDEAMTVCGRTPAYVDDFVPFLAMELGLDVPSRVTYKWIDADSVRRSCAAEAYGCAVGRVAYAEDPLLLHEVVHAIGSANAMNVQPFLREGLAEAYDPLGRFGLGPRYLIRAEGERLPDPRPLLDDWSYASGYGLPASFVAFLLARHGPESFVALARATSASPVFEMRATFRKIYGTELDAEAELFMAGAPCDGDEFAVRPYDCAMPSVPWSGGVWEFEAMMDCGEAEVAGGIDKAEGADYMVRSVVTDVTAGAYTLRVLGDGEVGIQIGACGGCPWTRVDVGARPGKPVSTTLEAGQHFVRIVAPSSLSTMVTVTLEPTVP